LQRIAECLEKLDEKPKAYDYYLKARLYGKAADLAQELGRPREDILSLRIEEAKEKGDFDGAAKIAEGLEDKRLVHGLKGHGYKHRKEYREAIPEFIEAEEWTEATEVLELGFARGDFTYSELYSQWCNIIRAVAKSEKALSSAEKEELMRIVRRVQEDPIWEDHIPLPDMGLVYEKCATFVDAARYYESYINERWAQEGWLRVKSAHCDYYKQRRDFDKAERINLEISRRKRTWGFEGLE
jgi:hypothetical protein